MTTPLSESLLASHPAIQKQIELEKLATIAGAARYRKDAAHSRKRGDGARTRAVERIRVGWYQAVKDAITREKAASKKNPTRYRRRHYVAAIHSLPSAVLAATTIDAGLNKLLMEGSHVSWRSFAFAIGKGVQAELNNKKVRKARRLAEMRRELRRVTRDRINTWARGVDGVDDPAKDMKEAFAIGDFLGAALMAAAHVEDRDGKLYPAIWRKKIGKQEANPKRRKRAAWRCGLSDEALATIESWDRRISQQRPIHLPMVVEPMPWQQIPASDGTYAKMEGGRITSSYSLVSKTIKPQRDAYRTHDLSPTFDGMAAMCRTPGRVDRSVAAVIEHFAAGKGGELDIPQMEDDPSPQYTGDPANEAELTAFKRERHLWYGRCLGLASERSHFAMGLTAMRTMLNVAGEGFEKIWFDPFLCYRGRAYCRSSSLNPQQRDIWRAALQFGDAVEPGEEGMRAIRIDAAGVYGHDNLSMVERDQWTQDHMAQIIASAHDPLGNMDFWTAADGGEAPWQFLQACFALADPEAAAHYPISLDGTANGLQHYTAMGLDEDAAGIVNMLESGETDRPNSPYTVVAGDVARAVGLAASTNPVAALVAGKIERGLVKQPVMTTVYGVTESGMRTQIAANLGFIPDTRVPKVNRQGETRMVSLRNVAAGYLEKEITKSLHGQFPRAMALMQWIRDVADVHSKAGRLFSFVTPNGFPVVGRDVSQKMTKIECSVGSYQLYIDTPERGVNARRQRNSSAPNVVHAIDANDMLYKAIRARQSDLSFWSVHDCFRTHGRNWGQMNGLVREAFIDLHSRDVVGLLYAQWKSQGLDVPPPPAKGTLDLSRLRKSTYFVK